MPGGPYIKMFTPFYGPNGIPGVPGSAARAGGARDTAAPGEDKRIDDLRARLEAMQKQLDDISGNKT